MAQRSARDPGAGADGGPAKDLRSFLDGLGDTGDLERVTRTVRPAEFDVTGLLVNLEREDRYPAVLFENPTGVDGDPSAIPLVSNVFADRRRIAQALDLPRDAWRMETSHEYARRERNRVAPELVERDDAPSAAIEVDGLLELPIVRHHRLDPAPYITMTPVLKDPESGAYNVAFLRTMLKDDGTLGIHMSPRHSNRIFRRNEEAGRPTPIAIVIGHHPAFYLGALTLAGYTVDEYDVIGGMLGEALRLTPSETWGDDFLVPADAEVVVEGEIRAGDREVEAPFGEFPGYYGPQRLRPVVDVTAITRREDAVFQHVFTGHPDTWIIGGVPKEGGIYNAIAGRVPGVKQVHLPMSGCGRFRCYVSLEPDSEGEAKHAGLQALAASDFVKQVVVVDADIDVFDEEQVLWAIATRVRPDEDLDLVKNVKGNTLDPSVRDEVTTTKVLVDATIPPDERYPPVLDVPDDALDRMRPADYLDGGDE